MNQPNRFDFLTHYRGNALSPIVLQFKYKSGEPVNLTGSTIRMEMKRPQQGRATFVFSSENDGDGFFNILDALEGKIQFPEIKSWGIPADNYTYDLVICDADGNSKCYLRGIWRVTQNISKIPCSDVSGGYSANYSGAGVVCHSQNVDIDGETYAVEVILIEVDYQERGEDGHTPYIVDGNWWINGVDTGHSSTGADGKSAFEVWNAENGGGNTIQDYFDYLRQPAIDASVIALDSAQLADNSASNANQATTNAVQATTDAQQATQAALDAIEGAEQATINANNARGWTPTSEFEEYNGGQIKKLTGYIGGTGTEPTDFIGQYFTENGFTTDKDLAINFKGQDGITTNLNPESPNTTLRMWEGTRQQYDNQEPLDSDVITFIREL